MALSQFNDSGAFQRPGLSLAPGKTADSGHEVTAPHKVDVILYEYIFSRSEMHVLYIKVRAYSSG